MTNHSDDKWWEDEEKKYINRRLGFSKFDPMKPSLPVLQTTFFSYTGRRISREEGHLGLLDIAVHLGRICRYGGGSRIFWPVLLHSMIVADLLPVRLEAHGLLHDMTDAIVGDIPKPFKLPESLALQHEMHDRFILGLGLTPLSPNDRAIVKTADVRAFVGEQVIAPPGRSEALERDEEAEALTIRYRERYRLEDYLEADGCAILDFLVRAHAAVERSKRGNV